MTIDISLVPGPVRAVPRAGVPFAPVPPAAPPRCPVSRPLPPPPDIRLPVMTVGGARPDRTGNVDLTPFLAGFVSHVGDPSIHHTALEIGQIAAAKVAAVVDGAPTALDTLKEIADVIGTEAGSGAAGILKRVADLESGKVDKIQGKGLSANDYTDVDKAKLDGLSPQAQADWGQTDTTAPDYIKNKPTIPASVTIDPALSQTSENPVQNKAVAAALADKLDKSGGTMTGGLVVAASNSNKAGFEIINGQVMLSEVHQGGGFAVPVQNLLALVATIAGKANASDVATALAQKADADALPYAMVTPGEWEFSELPSGYSDPVCEWNSSENVMLLTMQYEGDDFEIGNYDVTQDSLSVSFRWDEGPGTEAHVVTATRPSLPGHLLDRAGNRVVVTDDTTLTLPAANPGYIRDFLVRLEISGSTIPTITFAAPTGETIVYETDGDEFPVPDAAGTWLYSFTETAAHTFAVSLKQLQSVSQPVAQGGS